MRPTPRLFGPRLSPAEVPRRFADMEGTCRPVQPVDRRLRAKLRPAPFRGCNSRRREVAGGCCRLGSWRLSAYSEGGPVNTWEKYGWQKSQYGWQKSPSSLRLLEENQTRVPACLTADDPQATLA